MDEFWYAEKFEKCTLKDTAVKFSSNLSNINTKKGAENHHSRTKNGQLMPFLYLEKFQKLNALMFFCPVFAKSCLGLF